jgi:hypothetical protein
MEYLIVLFLVPCVVALVFTFVAYLSARRARAMRDAADTALVEAQKDLIAAQDKQIAALYEQVAALQDLKTEQGKYISTLKRYAGLPED